MAAEVGQELLNAKSQLEDTIQSLERKMCTCQKSLTSPYETVFQSQIDTISSPLRLPTSSPHTPQKSMRSPKFDLNSYIETLEIENGDLRKQLKSLAKKSATHSRRIFQLDNEREELILELTQNQDLM